MPNTREKLIELLGADTCKHGCCDDCEYCGSVDACVAYLKESMADHLIANGVTFVEDTNVLTKTIATDNNVGDKWIPVSERLPEDDLPKDTKRLMIRCLVFSDKGTVKPCVRQRWKHFDGQLVPWQWNKDIHAKPLYWMPLPHPPKEGE